MENNNTEYTYDDIAQQLEEQLKEDMVKLDFLEEEKEKISNPEYLGNAVMNVVWDQFVIQVGAVAGDDFIEKNRGLCLDLRKEAHIQTTENFAKGKIANHNDQINYQKRYDDWQNNFKRDNNGNIVFRKDNITGEDKAVLTKEARKDYDKGRPKGSKTVNMDHVVSAAEVIRDPEAAAHLEKKEKIDFANSEKNIHPLDAEANRSKGDHRMKEWLNYERNGQTPDERFNIDREELEQKDEEARKEYVKVKKEGENKSIETGKASRRKEAFRISGKALRSAVMVALADLIRNIISKLIAWLKQKEKNLQSLVERIKDAIKNFVSNLKRTIMNMSEAVASTVLSAIGNPVVDVIQKIWMIIKQGGRSVVEAINYLRDPDNRNKSFSVIILELGKIIVAGLTAVGALLIGEIIEGALAVIPGFALDIPLIGSLASIIGIFSGAVIAGVAGALLLNMLDYIIARQSYLAITQKQLATGKAVVAAQAQLVVVNEHIMNRTQARISDVREDRHKKAAEQIGETLEKVYEKNDSEQRLDEIEDSLSEI